MYHPFPSVYLNSVSDKNYYTNCQIKYSLIKITYTYMHAPMYISLRDNRINRSNNINYIYGETEPDI